MEEGMAFGRGDYDFQGFQQLDDSENCQILGVSVTGFCF
jgi:hypothetical protein